METYKLGNKINCIVRSGSSGKLGSKNMQYGNQPYTVIRDVSATMQFASQNKAARAHKETQLAFSLDNVSQLRLTNVPFTKPIFDLMFDSIEEDILCNTMMNFDVDEGGALELTSLIRDYESIYQVFIYNADGELVDGLYKQELNPGPGKVLWRGSTNQRIIDLNKTRQCGKIVLLYE